MNVQKITLTPVTPGAPTYIQATRGENNARALRFTIIGADNKPIDLTGCTVVFYVDRTKEEKGVVQVGAVVNEDNTATVTLPSGTCAASGEWGCWVQVIKPNVYDLRADNLILRVQPCGIDEEGEASSEFTLLTQLIVKAEEAISNLDASIPYNPNLLDNWYMGNPINQRGQTTYSTEDSWLYGIDRWKIANATISTTGGKIRFQASGTEGRYKRMTQVLEGGLKKGQYTLSVLAKVNEASGSVSLRACDASYSAIPGAPGKALTVSGAYTVYSNTFTLTEDIEGAGVEILCGNTTNDQLAINILACKLEIGERQTLAYEDNGSWVLNEIPNYTEQLFRCQRYQFKSSNASRWVRAARVMTNTLFFFLPYPTQLASNPAVVDSSALTVNNMSGQEQSGFTFSATAQNDAIRIQATKAGHGLTDANLELINALFDANL